jgi:hypothetical protein
VNIPAFLLDTVERAEFQHGASARLLGAQAQRHMVGNALLKMEAQL